MSRTSAAEVTMPPLWPPDLATRRMEPEMMEEEALEPRLHRQALAGLERLNRLNWIPRRYFAAVAPLASGGRPVRVLDLACGGGDIAIAVTRLAARRGLDLTVDGCDLNELALGEARRRAAAAGVGGRFFPHDLLDGPLPAGYDAMISSHFLHHLSDGQLVDLLRRAAEAVGRRLVLGDLRRTRWGYLLAWIGCRLLVSSRIVWHDAPRSVAAALTSDEAAAAADRAGLAGARIDHHWPQRFLLLWSRA